MIKRRIRRNKYSSRVYVAPGFSVPVRYNDWAVCGRLFKMRTSPMPAPHFCSAPSGCPYLTRGRAGLGNPIDQAKLLLQQTPANSPSGPAIWLSPKIPAKRLSAIVSQPS
ncbi:hypothetical protein AAFF_G00246300 [Aldrovandia affinis]|uniref:Uncharacterized protein n=1 Tax=Aldrovandia affinis TaxID=143900 RepID=A0AAD7SU06_9TELE|nr:hypothetical protein AAFF_G00246300 [Aldrovandia affinis]